jgi:hypothetical protein
VEVDRFDRFVRLLNGGATRRGIDLCQRRGTHTVAATLRIHTRRHQPGVTQHA